ncbi:ChbG/HpnK family deacetylase [Prochlorococcus sp. MIT 1300]|uniref:ChbG/HpnK family deacetylase n=1 Tax=Prochlorococcus sp. MIT 1300 TaxID=3096218 RepID=UPI002A74BDBC|nr:ChbG/HpnK family deacetylase [Prochlorococcus sp. MIT 1300]
MKITNLSKRLRRYAVVGLGAATTHAICLEFLTHFLPFWASNLTAFVAASVTSYIGHAIYTYQEETSGRQFARRWLIFQFCINSTVSALLPIALSHWQDLPMTKVILVLTPTVLNALIWNKAANFSKRRRRISDVSPRIHADDLGLNTATNEAIFSLAKSGHLDSASLLVNGPSVKDAIEQFNYDTRLELHLHICLTEGPTISAKEEILDLINKEGYLNTSFAKLMWLSILPKQSKKRQAIELQLTQELKAQINTFKQLTHQKQIKLDGHQHIHLTPIVLNILLQNAHELGIHWIRTTSEPWPQGIPLKDLAFIFANGGWLKWIILQALTILAKSKIKKAELETNIAFAGVLCTGRMADKTLSRAWRELRFFSQGKQLTAPLLLAHPSTNLNRKENDLKTKGFYLSQDFFSSEWRRKEWLSLKEFNRS